MSWERHHRVLRRTFFFAVNFLLLIQHGGSKCVHRTPRHLRKIGCRNYCPSDDQYPEECIGCISGFYGPDCRRSCRGHCFNGRCALLANGRAVSCTEGCVLGWRGLTCNTRCKRPCLECHRYTGDCLRQCRDGFCGAGCLQRCQYPLSTCDKSCARPMKQNTTQTMGKTHGRSRISNTHDVHKEEPLQQSAADLSPEYGRWQIFPYFGAGVAVLAAVISLTVVSVIRLRRQNKADSVGTPHSCEESHRFLAVKSNIISVIPPSQSDEGGGSGPDMWTTEMGVLVQKNH